MLCHNGNDMHVEMMRSRYLNTTMLLFFEICIIEEKRCLTNIWWLLVRQCVAPIGFEMNPRTSIIYTKKRKNNSTQNRYQSYEISVDKTSETSFSPHFLRFEGSDRNIHYKIYENMKRFLVQRNKDCNNTRVNWLTIGGGVCDDWYGGI